MKYFLMSILVISIVSCKNITTQSNQPGQEKYENVSCKDYSKEFKSALINVVKNQSDKFFKQPNNTSFQVFYSKEGSCINKFEKYSTVLADDKDNWAIEVTTKENHVNTRDCEETPSDKYSSELTKYNSKDSLLKEIQNQNIEMKIDTDRPCHVGIDSTKDYLKLSLFVEGQEVKSFNWNFKDMIHPAEVALRLENISYKRKLTPVVLENSELNTIVNDCLNKGSNEVCASTGRTLKEWLDLNQ